VPLPTRRQFVYQAPVARAALYGFPVKMLEALFEEREQKGAMLDRKLIERFASKINGQVTTPDSTDYESARLVFNRAFDRYPELIVRCSSAPDVARSLDFAQTHDLSVAVRSGGHSRAGFSVCDGGAVIDLSGRDRVEVDASKRVAYAEAGAGA
jgi:FAD/FMN-containing dehydrogenase